MRRTVLVRLATAVIVSAGAIGVFLAWPTLLTAALVVGAIMAVWLIAFVRSIDRLRDLWGTDAWFRPSP
jgi:hypothetical protein